MSGVESIVGRIKNMDSLAEWMAEDLVRDSKTVAQNLTKMSESDLNTQVRKFLDAVRKIEIVVKKTKEKEERFDREQVILLKPRIAYAVSRKKDLLPFFQVLDTAIDKVKDSKDFEKLVAFVESVIAYHRFFRDEKRR